LSDNFDKSFFISDKINDYSIDTEVTKQYLKKHIPEDQKEKGLFFNSK